MAGVEIVLAILQTMVQLQPTLQEAWPAMQKVISGQTITPGELKTLELAAEALNSQAEAGAKNLGA